MGRFSASAGASFVVQDASTHTDKNDNGQIDYSLKLTPKASFFNDTQAGLNFGYQLDLLKAQLEAKAVLPANALSGILDTLDLPSGVKADIGIGPLLRLEGSIDLLSADIFESAFDYDAGFGTLDGTVDTVVPDIVGTEGNDTLLGSSASEVIHGLGGNDRIGAGGGDDSILGGDGNDILDATGAGAVTLVGGEGNDTLLAGTLSSVLYGGDGNDSLRSANGSNLLSGGDGDDALVSHSSSNDTMTGGAGADTFFFTASHEAEAGAMDVIADFAPRNGTEPGRFDRLHIVKTVSQDVIAKVVDLEGPDVLVSFGLQDRGTSRILSDPDDPLARKVLFKDIDLATVELGLQDEFVSIV